MKLKLITFIPVIFSILVLCVDAFAGDVADELPDEFNAALQFMSDDKTEQLKNLIESESLDVDTADGKGFNLLLNAVRMKKLEAVECLLKIGADPNLCSDVGDTPMHIAADNDDLPVMKLLHEKKAYLDESTVFGDTPLHYAHSDEARDFLIGAKAATNIKNCEGLNYLEWNEFLALEKRFFEDKSAAIFLKNELSWTTLNEDVVGTDVNEDTKAFWYFGSMVDHDLFAKMKGQKFKFDHSVYTTPRWDFLEAGFFTGPFQVLFQIEVRNDSAQDFSSVFKRAGKLFSSDTVYECAGVVGTTSFMLDNVATVFVQVVKLIVR